MRPVNKGVSPYTRISKYSEALSHLEKRIGAYCSYCEFPTFHNTKRRALKEKVKEFGY